ncbi:class I SAM-dependent methyltransferase, partial [Pseudomonas sp. FSL R10-0765]|uniref:class I SAM-dependent methyltransferase n=1 Tax=Pseudomonas sp. FSL R10-0765 TaxID=2662195 RepID=UPI002115432E
PVPAARDRYRTRHGVFDIDRALLEQGYVSQSWDLIVAGGVLNAARDTEQTLSTLHALLKPGGWLVFSEPTREEFWVGSPQNSEKIVR